MKIGSGRWRDDLSGLAGGALSVAVGLKDECEAWMKARRELMLQRLDLARGEEVETLRALAARAVSETEALTARLAALEARLAACEERLAALAAERKSAGAAEEETSAPPSEEAPGTEGA
jgi:BMFP domain-containing protein YqiC